jgi:hypothetical protein
MKKTLVVLAAFTACLTGASSADARPKTGGSIEIFATKGVTAADSVSFGQLSSKKRSCVSDRKYEAIVSSNGRRTVIDRGRTSDEGALSAFVTVSDFPNDREDAFLSVAKSKKCAKVTGPLFPEPVPVRAERRLTPSLIDVIGVFNRGDDAVVGGFIDTTKPECRKKRKIKLVVGSKTTDVGATTPTDGTFALHLRSKELTGDQLAVLMPDAKPCAASVATFTPSPPMRPLSP